MDNQSKYTQHGSTIYMQLGTALGGVIGIISFLLTFFGIGNTTSAMIIMIVGMFGLRFIGYGIDKFIDKHAKGLSRTEKRQREREARTAAAAKKTGAKYVGGKQKDKKKKK